ncbi:plastocyanin/azurin family copper-binding protein [Oricola sp.]|uniref:cupredoxin domain-containing protein n=1 Tax=Oricola sp. TaxID=1979950 RepID=UPI00320BF1E1|nr:cupredoxin family protein [Oricola sp.]
MRLALLATALALSASAAYAAGTHSGGHGYDEMAVGRPGKAEHVDRTIEVVMRETDDGEMVFEPASLSVKAGETIRFEVKNSGELEHEFVLDHHDKLMEHKALMERFPEMEHDDPNSIRLAEKTGGEVIWTFSNAGEFEFGCLIPGHYDAGMKGSVTVSAN